uniref:Uncharacterized protein n=1 Tax=Fagus sylvatica TaxID=28930 RepID=A0A2N9J8K9_FAGSY
MPSKGPVLRRDLNPLHDVISRRDYKERYFKSLMPLGLKYAEDPGHRLLTKLIGETSAKDLLKNFLFNGINDLGSQTFLDYFPEYRREDGTINDKRSIIGKSFEDRPWDTRGEFIGKLSN